MGAGDGRGLAQRGVCTVLSVLSDFVLTMSRHSYLTGAILSKLTFRAKLKLT